MTLDEARAHVGSGVVYEMRDGRNEDGVITSVNDRYVFVLYRGDRGSKATEVEHLRFLADQEQSA